MGGLRRGERRGGEGGGAGNRRRWGTYAAFDSDTEGTGHCGEVCGEGDRQRAAGRSSTAEQRNQPPPRASPTALTLGHGMINCADGREI